MFGFGAKKPLVDVRAMLADAARDIGDEDLAQQALHFFDDPDAYLAWDQHSTGEPLWVGDRYKPTPSEVAADILRELLIADRRAVIIDWAEGAEGILDDIDLLFDRAGKPKIDRARRASLVSQLADAERGKAFGKLMDPIEGDAAERGLAIHWWDTESDSYLPVLLTPEARKRWEGVRFGRNFPVLR